MIAAVSHDYTPSSWKSSARSSPLLSYFLPIVARHRPAPCVTYASPSTPRPRPPSSSSSSRLPSSPRLLYPAVSIFIFLIAPPPLPPPQPPPPPPPPPSPLFAGQDGAVDEDVLPATPLAERDRLRISKRLDSSLSPPPLPPLPRANRFFAYPIVGNPVTP